MMNSKETRKQLNILYPIKKVTPYKNFCCYCDRPLDKNNFTREHVIPVSKRGRNTDDNIRDCCRECNQEKANLDLEKYIEYLQIRLKGLSLSTFEFELTARKIRNAKILIPFTKHPENKFPKYQHKSIQIHKNMKNKVEDLRNHLFAQLDRLSNKDTNLEQEISRAKAIVGISNAIISSAKVEVSFLTVLGENKGFKGTEFIPLNKEDRTPGVIT